MQLDELLFGKQAAELAKDFTSKLITSGAAEAKSSMMRLAGDVSSWWAALDPGLPQAQETSQPSARSQQVKEDSLFLSYLRGSIVAA